MDKNRDKNCYGWNAEDYAGHSEAQYTWAREMIEKLDLSGSESVLDIGCGDGKITAMIGSLLPGGNITGIDNSASMIALAQEKFPRADHPNVSFLKMDAAKLAFRESFDLAFSNAALHWIPDQASLLRGVEKSLKQSARIFFQMGGKGNARDVLILAHICIENGKWHQYFTDFIFPYTFPSPEEYKILLLDAGLIPERVELIPKDMTQKGKDGLAGWIRTTWLPYTDRLPENLKNQFISELVDAYIEEYPIDGDGLVHVQMVRLEVEAQKP